MSPVFDLDVADVRPAGGVVGVAGQVPGGEERKRVVVGSDERRAWLSGGVGRARVRGSGLIVGVGALGTPHPEEHARVVSGSCRTGRSAKSDPGHSEVVVAVGLGVEDVAEVECERRDR